VLVNKQIPISTNVWSLYKNKSIKENAHIADKKKVFLETQLLQL